MLAIELDTLDFICLEAFINTPVILTCTTSTSEDILSASSITLYPNPMVDELTLERKGVELDEVQIMVRNMYGAVLRNAWFLKGQKQHCLSLESLSSGVYVISIKSESRVIWNERFIKL